MDLLEKIARYAITQSVSLIIANPLKAVGAGVALSNPYTRSIVFDIGIYFAKNQARDIAFVSRTLYGRVAVPLGSGARNVAYRAATTPAVAIPAAAVATAAVGAAVSAGTVSMINDVSNTKGSGFDIWSPFGGFQLGTVV